MNGLVCEDCGTAPAKIHVTEIINENEKRERHLCEKCAAKAGIPVKNYSITELLAGIAASQIAEKAAEGPDITCPSCGLSFADFRSTGRFGCAEDYDVFGEHIKPRLERFHDSLRHAGKSPRAGDQARDRASRVRALRSQLREAVAAEAYERAAKVRDEIKGLEESVGGD